MGVRYRLAAPRDAVAIGILARRVVRRWILAEQPASAAPSLLSGLTARVIRAKILAGQRFQLAWQDDGRLVGVAAIRGDSHLFQFFVTTRAQGRGIAHRLWQRAMRDAVRRAGTHHFTLNATRLAVPVYLHFGFVPSGPVTVSSTGLVAQPMHLDLPR